jgi:hypothetical protein
MDSLLEKLEQSIMDASEIQTVFDFLKEYLIQKKESIETKTHPLGFYAINLGSNHKNVNLRLHIWNGDLAPQNQNLMIHNHVFNMKSLVIIGQLTNVIYEINGDKNGTPCFTYNTSYNKTQSLLTKVCSKSYLSEKRCHDVMSGEYYSLDKDLYHESILKDDNYTATLLRTELNETLNPIVISKEDLGDKIVFNRTSMELNVGINLIDELFEKYKNIPHRK